MKERRILEIVAAIGATDDMGKIRSTALEMIRSIVWFDTANFWLYPPLASLPQQALVSLDSPQRSLTAYLQHYINMDEFHQSYNRSNLLIARSTDLLDYSDWTQRSEYYNDFLKSNNAHYLLGFDIKDSRMAYGAICFHREKHNGNFNDKDLSTLSLVYPHLVNRFRWLYEKQALLSRLQSCVSSETVNQNDYFEALTLRERGIAQQVLAGKSNQEIAKNLGLSINTVKMHLQNIYIKLGIRRRSQLFTLYPG